MDILFIETNLPSKYEDKRALKFWTSGANDGDQCDVEGSYAWCSLSEIVPKGLLTAYMKPANLSTERCLLLNAAGKDNNSALAHSDCTVKMPYICEPACKGPTCPSVCVKNVQKTANFSPILINSNISDVALQRPRKNRTSVL
jgi:hypothetical protein